MAVHVRLMRMGKKKQAFYRIVAIDSRRARDGRFLEVVGTYNPITKPAVVKIHEDKLSQWLDTGAEPSDTVRSLLTQVGFMEKYLSAKAGKDVSEAELKTTINERNKKTRKIKKATLAAEEAKAAEVEAKAKADKEAKAAAEAKAAEDAKAAEEAKAAAEAKATEDAKAAEAPADEKPADDAAEKKTEE